MVWIYLVTYSHGPLDAHVYAAQHNTTLTATPLGTLWDELFSKYYPMTLAMIAGSLIAGSTPLGGGVVAFPVAVLIIGFKPAEGRDFTVLIQSVGMNAAAYLIAVYKSHLLDFTLIATFVLAGVPGILVGLALNLAPFYVVLTFQVVVLEFAIVFFYLKVLAPRSSPSAIPTVEGASQPPDASGHNDKRMALAYATMCIAAAVGGFLTANVGSGSDIMLYGYGLLGWNLLVPTHRQFSDTSLTASSVVVMGILSLVTTVCRALTRDISVNVLYCWGATAWIVCFGAPLGSLLLTPGLRAQLRIAFYFLAIAQFIGFAVLKIATAPAALATTAWTAFGCVTFVITALLGCHAFFNINRLGRTGVRPEKLTTSVLKYRLLKG